MSRTDDVGTVEDGVTEALEERGILGYRVLWFEDDEPTTWPARSLASVTTHDLPTVAGVWSGSDVGDQLAGGETDEADVRAARAELLKRLRQGGLPETADVAAATATATATATAHAYQRLGEASSLLLAVTLDDALGARRRPNIPGTTNPGQLAHSAACADRRPPRARRSVDTARRVGGPAARRLASLHFPRVPEAMARPTRAAVAATGSWIDPDGFRTPAGEVHAWLPGTNQTICGVPVKKAGLGRFSHVDWLDVQPATGRDADRVTSVCRKCLAGTGHRRDERPWTRNDPRP